MKRCDDLHPGLAMNVVNDELKTVDVVWRPILDAYTSASTDAES